ncbi:hypothetical protein CU044_3783 [Streptomyces sp. L-9-10]|uniref:hypothetical protein n=1 Tax=Streptomyces sp. L-9-10 TaxID=1478131 RepID=UPI00101D9841|nr:hypothetical protein [Streptomyces sp. L-9-10]RYJ26490.1 hypothetical protein CU044_3783 [Streptomyces sp. L-9-10]
MPATTPRGYPYPVPTDPADVPQAMQDLASAVDTDVQTVYNGISARPSVKAVGQTVAKYTNVVSGSLRGLPFEYFDFNVGGAVAGNGFSQQNSFKVIVQGGFYRVIPQKPGFWMAFGAASFPKPAGGVAAIHTAIVLLLNDSTIVSRSGINGNTLAADGTAQLVTSGGALCNGTTDFFNLAWTPTHTSTIPSITVNNRNLTLIRMTQG